MDDQWYLKSVDETVAALKNSRHGLPKWEAKERRKQYGKNALAISTEHSLWAVFFRQFLTPFFLILAIAAGVKFAVSNYTDAVVLLATIFLIIMVGFVQEMKAENALRLLKQFAAHKSKVKRGGKLQFVLSETLFPEISSSGNGRPDPGRCANHRREQPENR